MITIKLNGGLGNQMFQYAIGRHLSKKNKTELHLDLQNYQKQHSIDTDRYYELGAFDVDVELKNSSLGFMKKNVISSQIIDIIKSVFGLKKMKTVRELTHSFDSGVLEEKGNIVLEGYWQSQKYFSDIEDIIREDFSFKSTISKQNQSLINNMKNKNSISIHVRRGDYVSNPTTNAFHGICDLEYYDSAILHMQKKIDKSSWYIFSDDIEWTKENIRPKGEVHYIEHNKDKDSFEDMRLMSHCKHNIIANSSFSWWGAWLNNNPDKIIIAPKKWFQDSSINIKDKIPDGWIKI